MISVSPTLEDRTVGPDYPYESKEEAMLAQLVRHADQNTTYDPLNHFNGGGYDTDDFSEIFYPSHG